MEHLFSKSIFLRLSEFKKKYSDFEAEFEEIKKMNSLIKNKMQ